MCVGGIRRYEIEYNGKSNTEIGILIKNRPSIPCPEYEYETIKIPGRDGELYKELKSVSDITIPIEFTFACEPYRWQAIARNARKWIMGEGERKLVLSDNPDRYYKVKHATMNETERQVKKTGEFTVDFVCEGRQYLIEGESPLDLDFRKQSGDYGERALVWNPYDDSAPLYIVEGNGHFKMRVNGSPLDMDINGEITLDTRREVAYKRDMSSANTLVTCNYRNMYLKAGENVIEKTVGFNLKIIPRWREL